MTKPRRFPRLGWFWLLAGALWLGGCMLFRPASNNDRSIIEVINFFEKNGLVISEIQATMYPVIMAEDGCALFIDGAKVEVYRYDLRKPKIKQKVERIAATGKIIICGIEFPAEANGSFVLLTYSRHPKMPDIITVFRHF